MSDLNRIRVTKYCIIRIDQSFLPLTPFGGTPKTVLNRPYAGKTDKKMLDKNLKTEGIKIMSYDVPFFQNVYWRGKFDRP